MPVRSQAVGSSTEEFLLEVTPRLTMAYASGIGDPNPYYMDDASSEPVLAPPAFCVSPEWPPVVSLPRAVDLGTSAEEAVRGVHALQDSVFHRPIRAGDRIRTRGVLVAVRATRAGAYTLTRVDSVLDPDEEPVVTSFYGSMFRGVEVLGPDREIDAPPDFPKPDAGAALDASLRIATGPQIAHIYTECARIWNPIHTERRVAKGAGLPDIIVHGTALWALASRELVNRCAQGEPWRLRRLSGRFTGMVIPGETLELSYTSSPAPDGSVRYLLENESGAAAISDGLASFDL